MQPLRNLASLAPTKQAYSLWEEFRAFAFKGNVIDLAVGVIIGAAFGNIIQALVKDIIMPLVSLLLPGDQGYQKWVWVVNGKEVPYGDFIAQVVNFVIIALVLFVFVVKLMGWLMSMRKQEAAAVPPLTKDQQLLTEIRDLLQKREAPPVHDGPVLPVQLRHPGALSTT